MYHAKHKSADYYKIARKRRRAEKKDFTDKKSQEEEGIYMKQEPINALHWVLFIFSSNSSCDLV